MSESYDLHFDATIDAIRAGRIVPLLGAGVNLCGRPDGADWERGRFLPSGSELAHHLARAFGYPENDVVDLVRVSQYATIFRGSGPLYDELHTLFNLDYPPTPLHRFLAGVPGTLRAKGLPPRYQLIVTTNYDDVLERAFRDAGESYDLVSYVAEGEHRGKFLHTPPEGPTELIERPNEYRGLSLDHRTVILKIHGAVDRLNADQDSYVITEDHYIDYLTRTDISALVPATLAARLRRSHFLFLGYGLRDWNLRVILHRIWGEQKLSYRSWAVQINPDDLDRRFWNMRAVEILDIRLEEYVAALAERLDALPAGDGA